jgi:hypothetical protein
LFFEHWIWVRGRIRRTSEAEEEEEEEDFRSEGELAVDFA